MHIDRKTYAYRSKNVVICHHKYLIIIKKKTPKIFLKVIKIKNNLLHEFNEKHSLLSVVIWFEWILRIVIFFIVF